MSLQPTTAVPRVVLLSSVRSTYGAQVLRSAMKAQLNVVAIIIEATRSRGGWRRVWRYIRKRRIPSILFRGGEVLIDRFLQRWQGSPELQTIETAAAASGIPLEKVANLKDADAHAIIASYDPA